jgi:methionyl-tRNA synthetase
MSPKPFYITTPIYYVNDKPHIGHTYTTVIADTVARYRRQLGDEVFFLTGTDEHGQKVERAARKLGLEPIELADRVVERFKSLWKRLDITNDDFIRTTEPRHRLAVEKLFRKIWESGDIYLDKYEGWYCTGCEAFFPESQIAAGKCPEQGHPVERTEEASYFFRLSKYQEPLLKLYREQPGFVVPDSRRNEVERFVASGLRDLSISRTTFRWGIPFPENPDHIFYVWFDALTNYLSAIDYADDSDRYRRFWPTAIHLVGKDILRFHAVYWPAFLMSAGLPLPRCIVGHGWWLRDEGKMSKSRGNVIEPNGLIDDFGVDTVRYFLLREMTFGLDSNYSDEALIDRANVDLANDLGNLASRTLTLLGKNCGGRIPAGSPGGDNDGLAGVAETSWRAFRDGFDRFAFHDGLAGLWKLVGEMNRYLVRKEPWKLAGDASRRAELDNVLYGAAEGLRMVAVCLAPVVPELSERLWRSLGCPGSPAQQDLSRFQWGSLPAGQSIPPLEPLFPRIDKKAYTAQVTTGTGQVKNKEKKKMTTEDRIGIEEFMKLDLRVGKIVEASKVEGTKKLMQIIVDLGAEKRQIVAGIGEQYTESALVGKQIVLVANLKPAKIRGVESNGMLLAADAGGAPIIATFEEEVPLGTRVR